METYQEWLGNKQRKKTNMESGVNKTPAQTSTPITYHQWLRQKHHGKEDIQTDIGVWAKDTEAAIRRIGEESKSWYGEEQYNVQLKRIEKMLTEAKEWRKQYIGNENVLTNITTVERSLQSASDYVKSYYEFYTKWDDAESYKKDEKVVSWFRKYNGKTYKELIDSAETMEDGEEKRWIYSFAPTVMTKEDYHEEITKAQAAVDEMTELYEKADILIAWYEDYLTNTMERKLDPETTKKNLNDYQKLVDFYGGAEGLSAKIQEKRWKIKQLERGKEKVLFSAVNDMDSENYDPDFAEKSRYISSIPLSNADDFYSVPQFDFYGQSNGEQHLGHTDLTYEYINHNENIPVNPTDEKHNYHWMNEEEIAIYNYYYNTQGKNTAEHYLMLIQDDLNQRAAQARFDELEGDTFREIVFGLEAGVDRFSSGLESFFNREDDYIPVSDTQILAGKVREDLSDYSVPLYYNFRTGKWEDRVLGNSAGQMIFDITNSVGYALPGTLASIAADALLPGTGKFVNSGLMAISAAGNAYQEMLNLGCDADQARGYSLMVGAAEAGMSYLVEGGAKWLGGTNAADFLGKMIGVDNALAVVAGKLGKNMLTEGVEEALTESMTPLLKNMMLGTNEELDWGQIFYAGVLGAITANLFEGSGMIKDSVSNHLAGKNRLDPGIAIENIKEVRANSPDVIKQLTARMDETSGAYSMGRLLCEMGYVVTDTNVENIVDNLKSFGVRSSDSEIIANAFVEVTQGKELTKAQSQVMEANDVLLAAVHQALQGEHSLTHLGSSEGDNVSKRSLAMEGKESLKEGSAGGADSIGLWNQASQFLAPNDRSAFRDYKAKVDQYHRTEKLLAKEKMELASLTGHNASPERIQQKRKNIAELEKLLRKKEAQVRAAESHSHVQDVLAQIEKTVRANEDSKTDDFEKQDIPVSEDSKTAIEIIEAYDTIIEKGHIITDGSHISQSGLQPNVFYQTGEHSYIYQTNGDGLISKVYVKKLELKTHRNRLRHERNPSGKKEGDHAGHLIADRFGGSPFGDNIVAQKSIVNLGEYKRIENQWAAALAKGEEVSVEITVNYENGSSRPSSFLVEYAIGDQYFKTEIRN